MKKRLFTQGLLTTILGVGVLGFAGYVVYTDMANGQSAQEAITATSGWMAVGGLLLRSKSTLLTDIFKKQTAETNDNGITPH